MAFARHTTVRWLLDLGHSVLFTLIGCSFVRKYLKIKIEMINDEAKFDYQPVAQRHQIVSGSVAQLNLCLH